MWELWEAARFKDAAAVYDAEALESPPAEAMILRARAYLKSDEAPAAIGLLERIPPGSDALHARRSMVLASAHAQIDSYAVADELFDAAAAAASQMHDSELAGDVAFYRGQRYVFERRPDLARKVLPQARALATPFGQMRALLLENLVLCLENHHRDQALVLLQLLGRIDPNRSEYMEIRAWATYTLATLARELFLPEALVEIERQLGGVDWPPDFDERRFQTLKALGWARGLRGDYFNAFRFLRLGAQKATNDAWRTIAAAERAELARCMGEHLWARQELAEAEEHAGNVSWNTIRDETRLGLLLLAELFVPIDAAKAAYYQARFNEYENIKGANYLLRDDPRLEALAQYSSAVVDLSAGHHKFALGLLENALETFRAHGYDWRAGRCALRLYEETRDEKYLRVAGEHLRNYMGCWLGDELRRLGTPAIDLPLTRA